MLNMILNTILRRDKYGLRPLNAFLLIVILGVFGCSRSEYTIKSVNIKIPVFAENTYDSIEVVANSNSKQIIAPLEKLIGDTLEMNLRIKNQQFPSPGIEAQIFMENCKIKRINLHYDTSAIFTKTYIANSVEFIGTCDRQYETRTTEYRSCVMKPSVIETLNKHGYDLKISMPEELREDRESVIVGANMRLEKSHSRRSK